jgi:hypothetical protein
MTADQAAIDAKSETAITVEAPRIDTSAKAVAPTPSSQETDAQRIRTLSL